MKCNLGPGGAGLLAWGSQRHSAPPWLVGTDLGTGHKGGAGGGGARLCVPVTPGVSVHCQTPVSWCLPLHPEETAVTVSLHP